jgi:hypothetical protein
MKKLFVLILFFFTSCGLYEENHRNVKYNLADGTEVGLRMYERQYPLTQRRLTVYGRKASLEGRDCEDAELNNFSDKVWSEIVKQNDLSNINAGTIFWSQGMLNPATPKYCTFTYEKKDNGEWTKS